MSKRAKIILVSVIAIVLVPTFILILALQNPLWANTPFSRGIEENFSRFILSHFNVMTVPEGQNLSKITKLSPAKLSELRSGKIKILSARDISGKGFKEPAHLSDCFVIATIDPVDIEGKRESERRRILTAVDDLAAKGKVDVVVEATASDIARGNPWGFREVKRLNGAGVLRCVIFDGGHHIGTLPLMPDIILTPVLYYNNELCASHWFTRDSVPIDKLRKALKREGMDILIARFSRNGIPAKNPTAMGMLASQAISNMAKAAAAEKNNPENNPASKKKGSLFISFDAGESPTREHVLEVLRDIVKEKTKTNEKIGRVYAGITYGTSHFPHISEKVTFSTGKLEAFLNKRLHYKVTVMSEPAGTWDAYLHRIGLY